MYPMMLLYNPCTNIRYPHDSDEEHVKMENVEEVDFEEDVDQEVVEG
jgi:hypothetical protein